MSNRKDVFGRVNNAGSNNDVSADYKNILRLYEEFARKRSNGTFYQILSIVFMVGSILNTARGESGYLYLLLAVLVYIPYAITYKANREADYNHLKYLTAMYVLGEFTKSFKIFDGNHSSGEKEWKS